MSVRVEWYQVAGYGGLRAPVLRVEGEHWNPEADETEFTEVAPGVFEPDDPEDGVPWEVALTFSGDEVGVLGGTLDELRAWINAADQALAEHEDARAGALAKAPCKGWSVGEHQWQLMEDGYLRTWVTTVETDEDGTITGIRAAFSGTESFSESGDGYDFLQCQVCQARMAVPDDVDVDYC